MKNKQKLLPYASTSGRKKCKEKSRSIPKKEMNGFLFWKKNTFFFYYIYKIDFSYSGGERDERGDEIT
jgi:hypothetical protein